MSRTQSALEEFAAQFDATVKGNYNDHVNSARHDKLTTEAVSVDDAQSWHDACAGFGDEGDIQNAFNDIPGPFIDMSDFKNAPPALKKLAATSEAKQEALTTAFQAWLKAGQALEAEAGKILGDAEDAK